MKSKKHFPQPRVRGHRHRAGSGIDRSFSLELTRRGGNLLCVDVNSERAQETARHVNDLGSRGLAYTCDVGDAAQFARMAAGLAGTEAIGLTTNLPFLRELLAWEKTRTARMLTRLIEQSWAQRAAAAATAPDVILAAASQWWLARERARSDWGARIAPALCGWRTAAGAPAPSSQPAVILDALGHRRAVHFAAPDEQGCMRLRLAGESGESTLQARRAGGRFESDTGTWALQVFDEAGELIVHGRRAPSACAPRRN